MSISVCQVLNRRFPPTHVVVTPSFWLTWFGPTFFPGRIVDIEISRRFKLYRWYIVVTARAFQTPLKSVAGQARHACAVDLVTSTIMLSGLQDLSVSAASVSRL